MSKVIRYPYKIKCPYCKCLIAYSEANIHIELNAYGRPIEMVSCPNCSEDPKDTETVYVYKKG